MELQEEAVSCGIDSLSYWHMTPRDIRAAVKGYSKRIKAEVEAQFEMGGFMAWLAGRYNSFASNDPKHYPDRPWTTKEAPQKDMTDDEMESWAKAWASQKQDNVI